MIVDNNPNLHQANQMLAQNKQIRATMLNAKNKDSFHKRSKHDVKFRGNKQDGNKDDLIKINKKNKGVVMIKCFTQ